MEPAARAAAGSARRDSDSDFSLSVNKKLKQSSRTGQACDRCKIRKIRCDSSVGSCGPCRQAHQPCRTTDRISGRAQSRGHSDVVETENRILKETLKQYRQIIQSYGIPIDDLELGSQQQAGSLASNGFTANPSFQPKPHASSSNESPPDTNNQNVITVIPLLTKPSPPSDDPSLKLFRGKKLDLFGMQIDGAEFDDEFEDTESAKSYQGLIAAQQIAFREPRRAREASLIPQTKASATNWAIWYFKAVNPYAPSLHKPDMFKLLDKIYPDDHLDLEVFLDLPAPDKVMVHMMFAIIKHQVGQRNNSKEHIDDAVYHFVTSMTSFPWLLQAKTLSHVQALAILSVFARNYQKPEAAWFIIHPAVWAAIELGLNRSASTLPEEERQKLSAHDIEMRKRIFWVIFGIGSMVSGRLGRPLPLRIQDIDVEFFEPIPDCLPEETNLTEFEKCSFIVSIVGSKLTALTAQLYSNTFALRRNLQTYEADLAQLEREYQVWRTNVPPELAEPDKAMASVRVFAIYVRLWDLEFQFFLHHPVLINKHYNTAALKKCLDICDQFLPLIDELRIMKCLDSQWIFVSLLLAVIFTVLFVYDVRGQEITQEDFDKLQKDMHLWQDILGTVGEMQGVGSRLQRASNRIISSSLAAYQHRLHTRLAAAAPPTASAEAINQMPMSQNPNTTANNYLSANNNSNIIDPKAYEKPITTSHPFMPKIPNPTLEAHSYDPSHSQPQTVPSYYPGPAGAEAQVPYHASPNVAFNPPTYQATPDLNPQYNGNPNSYYAVQGQDISQNVSMMEQWLRWTQANINLYNPQAGPQPLGQEYLNSAASLVELSGRPMALDDATAAAAAAAAASQPQQAHPIAPIPTTASEAPRWPMNFLGNNPNGLGTGSKMGM